MVNSQTFISVARSQYRLVFLFCIAAFWTEGMKATEHEVNSLIWCGAPARTGNESTGWEETVCIQDSSKVSAAFLGFPQAGTLSRYCARGFLSFWKIVWANHFWTICWHSGRMLWVVLMILFDIVQIPQGSLFHYGLLLFNCAQLRSSSIRKSSCPWMHFSRHCDKDKANCLWYLNEVPSLSTQSKVKSLRYHSADSGTCMLNKLSSKQINVPSGFVR